MTRHSFQPSDLNGKVVYYKKDPTSDVYDIMFDGAYSEFSAEEMEELRNTSSARFEEMKNL